MDAKQAIDILRDEDKHMASPENAENGIWTHTELTVVEANDIANLIERMQSREAELVQALWEELNQLYGECLDCANSTTTTKVGEISVCKCEKTHRIDKIRKALQGGSEYAEYVRKLEAVAKAAEKCKKAYDDGDNYEISFTRTAIWDALADWRSRNES